MNYKRLLPLLTVLLLSNWAGAQKSKTVTVDIENYRTLVSDRARLRVDSATGELLKDDTARLKNVIRFKDQAFLALKKQNDYSQEEVDTLQTIRNIQADIITNQTKALQMKDEKIAKLEARSPSLGKRILGILAAVVTGYVVGKF